LLAANVHFTSVGIQALIDLITEFAPLGDWFWYSSNKIVVDPVGIVEPMKVTVEPLTEYALAATRKSLSAATAGSANAASTVAANKMRNTLVTWFIFEIPRGS